MNEEIHGRMVRQKGRMHQTLYQYVIMLLILSLWTPLHAQNATQVANLIREGRTSEARRILRQMSEGREETEGLLFLQGLLTTDGDSAAALYQRILETYPDGTYIDDALFRLAQLKYAQGFYKTAQGLFRRLIQEHAQSPLHQQGTYWIGLCYRAMGQTDSATVYFHQAVDNFGESAFSDAVRQEFRIQNQGTAEGTPVQAQQISDTRFAIQVFAFTSQNRAMTRKTFFESKGYQVVLRTKTVNNQLYYLVWLGWFDTKDAARQFGEQVKIRYGLTSYQVVSE